MLSGFRFNENKCTYFGQATTQRWPSAIPSLKHLLGITFEGSLIAPQSPPSAFPLLSSVWAALRSASLNMGERMGSPPVVEDQARLLEDALIMVRQQTHQMRKCLETPGKLMDALKCRYAKGNYPITFVFFCPLIASAIRAAPPWYLSFEQAAWVPSSTMSFTCLSSTP